VAPYTALFLSSTFDDVDRFPDSKHACAYLGLVPSLNQSGDMVQLGHITKEGNSRLRRNLTECARVAVRKDPHLRGFYLKLKHKRGERKALIAVARKLASYAYWMLKRNVTYEELAPWTASWGQQGSPPSEQGEEGATRRRANLKESGEDPRIVECQPLQAERACGSERENTTKRADFKSLK
jgi:hypothetical protein